MKYCVDRYLDLKALLLNSTDIDHNLCEGIYIDIYIIVLNHVGTRASVTPLYIVHELCIGIYATCDYFYLLLTKLGILGNRPLLNSFDTFDSSNVLRSSQGFFRLLCGSSRTLLSKLTSGLPGITST